MRDVITDDADGRAADELIDREGREKIKEKILKEIQEAHRRQGRGSPVHRRRRPVDESEP